MYLILAPSISCHIWFN